MISSSHYYFKCNYQLQFVELHRTKGRSLNKEPREHRLTHHSAGGHWPPHQLLSKTLNSHYYIFPFTSLPANADLG